MIAETYNNISLLRCHCSTVLMCRDSLLPVTRRAPRNLISAPATRLHDAGLWSTTTEQGSSR